MEPNLDSVLDRLRILEEKMERGIPVQAVQAAAPGQMPAYAAAAEGMLPGEMREAPKPTKAAPEDLQKIRAQWKMIVGQTSGMFRQFLQKAVPKYNGETGDARLFVEFQDSLGAMYVNRPEAVQELRQIIEQTTGKTVEIEMILADQKKNNALSEISVDRLLEQAVHMPIEYDAEEDPEKFE